jgi:hypothetical protein
VINDNLTSNLLSIYAKRRQVKHTGARARRRERETERMDKRRERSSIGEKKKWCVLILTVCKINN